MGLMQGQLRLAVILGGALACLAAAPAGADTASGTLNSTVAGKVREIHGVFDSLNADTVTVTKLTAIVDHGIIEFDIGVIPGPVSSATLNLFKDDTAGLGVGSIFADIYAYAGDGVLSASDFDAGALVLSGVPVSAAATIAVDVTDVINAVIGSPYAGINIRSRDELFSGLFRVDGLGEAAPPTLDFVTAIPLPPALALLAPGLAVLLRGRRRPG